MRAIDTPEARIATSSLCPASMPILTMVPSKATMGNI